MRINPNLSSMEYQRYIHQITLPKIGIHGQTKLKKARVLCVGAGGLGTPLLLYLSSAGIGMLGIVEDDTVELTNLHRQILYDENDIGLLKSQCAQDKLLKHNSHTKVNVHPTRLDEENAQQIIEQYDIVADCSDNFTTRYLLNDICFHLNKPLVSASIFQFQGQCTTFLGKQSPCLRCLYPKNHAGELQNCEEAGVLGMLPGLLGLIQASEVIKYLLQMDGLLTGRLLTVDILTMQFRDFQFAINPDCDLCRECRNIDTHENLLQEMRLPMSVNKFIISPCELNELLKNNEKIQLIDVRTPEKHAAFNIGGKLIPFDELPNRLNELTQTQPIVTYCTSGGRSMMALQFLMSAGFTSVKSLDGGMIAWQKEIES